MATCMLDIILVITYNKVTVLPVHSRAWTLLMCILSICLSCVTLLQSDIFPIVIARYLL